MKETNGKTVFVLSTTSIQVRFFKFSTPYCQVFHQRQKSTYLLLQNRLFSNLQSVACPSISYCTANTYIIAVCLAKDIGVEYKSQNGVKIKRRRELSLVQCIMHVLSNYFLNICGS
jgi:hypothetical protein